MPQVAHTFTSYFCLNYEIKPKKKDLTVRAAAFNPFSHVNLSHDYETCFLSLCFTAPQTRHYRLNLRDYYYQARGLTP